MIYGIVAAVFLAAVLLVRWAMNWGSTDEERALALPGDAYFEAGRHPLTRAVSIAATPEVVWPWLAQMGRGAGFYSFDRLDNGGRRSARHLVDWIPEPQLGDATAIGYLRRIEPGRALTWWLRGLRFAGAECCLTVDIKVAPEGDGSRLLIRMSGAAKGIMGPVALLVFRVLDCIMAVRQLVVLRSCIERHRDTRGGGARDEFQLYEIIYASGESAGTPGKEHAARWRALAQEDGVL